MSDRKVSCVIRERKLEPPSFKPLECEHCESLKAEVKRLRSFAEWCADMEGARFLLGHISDTDWLRSIEERATQALQEAGDD
jgi:hypothetical protein